MSGRPFSLNVGQDELCKFYTVKEGDFIDCHSCVCGIRSEVENQDMPSFQGNLQLQNCS